MYYYYLAVIFEFRMAFIYLEAQFGYFQAAATWLPIFSITPAHFLGLLFLIYSVCSRSNGGSKVPELGIDKGSLEMTVSLARNRRRESNKVDHFRRTFCYVCSPTEREKTNGCHSGNGLIVSGWP